MKMSKFDKYPLPGQSQKTSILNELMNVLREACALLYVRVSLQLVICSLIELRLAVPNKLKYNKKHCKKQTPFSDHSL